MRLITCDDRRAYPGPSVQVVMLGLGNRDPKLSVHFRHHGSDERTLLLEGVHVTEKKIELYPTDPHRSAMLLGGATLFDAPSLVV